MRYSVNVSMWCSFLWRHRRPETPSSFKHAIFQFWLNNCAHLVAQTKFMGSIDFCCETHTWMQTCLAATYTCWQGYIACQTCFQTCICRTSSSDMDDGWAVAYPKESRSLCQVYVNVFHVMCAQMSHDHSAAAVGWGMHACAWDQCTSTLCVHGPACQLWDPLHFHLCPANTPGVRGCWFSLKKREFRIETVDVFLYKVDRRHQSRGTLWSIAS